MFEKEVTIQNATGLHARPASLLTQFCKKYPEQILLIHGEKQVDPKSIINVLAAGMKKGTTVTVRVDGGNDETICNEIIEFIEGLTE